MTGKKYSAWDAHNGSLSKVIAYILIVISIIFCFVKLPVIAL